MILNQITLPCTEDIFHTCLEFYQTLGLKLIVHTHDAYARFECPAEPDGSAPTTLSLHVVDGDMGPPAARAVTYFEFDDLAVEVVRLRAVGLAVSDPVDQSWLWTEATLNDPAGNPIKLYSAGENRRFPPWRKDGTTADTATD